jgi:hypothetical protein
MDLVQLAPDRVKCWRTLTPSVLSPAVEPCLLNGLPSIPIPRFSPPIRCSSILNFFLNTFPLSRSWSSYFSYTLKLTAENLIEFSGTIHPIDMANPIQSSHSYVTDNVHVCIESAIHSSI